MGVVQAHFSTENAFDDSSDELFIPEVDEGLVQGGTGRGFVGIGQPIMDPVKFDLEFVGVIF